MILVGQSMQLHRGPLREALRRRDPGPFVSNARGQLDAGADALDVNLGRHGAAEELVWTVRALRSAGVDAPLWLDSADPALLARAIATCSADGPLVANALPARTPPHPDHTALIEACQISNTPIVISPFLTHTPDRQGLPAVAFATWERVALGASSTSTYVDALAMPLLRGSSDWRSSLRRIEAITVELPFAVPLVAVGNVSYKLPRLEGHAARACYAAAAHRAGAGALILPVEDEECVQAALSGEAQPPSGASDAEFDAWRAVQRLIEG